MYERCSVLKNVEVRTAGGVSELRLDSRGIETPRDHPYREVRFHIDDCIKTQKVVDSLEAQIDELKEVLACVRDEDNETDALTSYVRRKVELALG